MGAVYVQFPIVLVQSSCIPLRPCSSPCLFFFLLLGPLGTSATEWPIVPAPGDYDDGEFGGMKIGRGNRST
jgi:hypothetical protein